MTDAEAILEEARALGFVAGAEVNSFDFVVALDGRTHIVRVAEGPVIDTARCLVRALGVLERSRGRARPALEPMPSKTFRDRFGRVHTLTSIGRGVLYTRTRARTAMPTCEVEVEIESRYPTKAEWRKSLENYEFGFPGIIAALGGLA